jgi:hypothetical protein
MLSAFASCLDPATAPPPLRAAAAHALAFVASPDPAPLGPEQLLSEVRAALDAIRGVVSPTRLADVVADDWDEAAAAEEEAAAVAAEAAAAAAAAADSGPDGGGGGGGGDGDSDDDGGGGPALAWQGGPEVFGHLRRNAETHRRVLDGLIAGEAEAVGRAGVGRARGLAGEGRKGTRRGWRSSGLRPPPLALSHPAP